jgi:hypothetical protein
MKKIRKKPVAIILVIAILITSFAVYYNYTDTFMYFYTDTPPNPPSEVYVELVFTAGGNLTTKLFEDEMEKISVANRKAAEIYEKYSAGEYIEPINVQAYIEIKDGGTVFTYTGTITTKENETIDYYYRTSINCIPTFDIPEIFKTEN